MKQVGASQKDHLTQAGQKNLARQKLDDFMKSLMEQWCKREEGFTKSGCI